MSDTPIEHVSDTALWVASYRATENERPDALFHDPFAARLVGERGHEIAKKMENGDRVQWVVVVRTCIIDAFILAAIGRGVDTILNLGAGLDTRPYRMDLPPNLRWIEVDYPHVIEHKQSHLRDERPRCALERVKLDLADVAARKRFLDDVASRSPNVLVLTEGVTPYLSNDEVASLADDLRARACFRYWILDYISNAANRKIFHGRSFRRQMRNAPFKFVPTDWKEFFATHGWKIKEIRYTAEEGVRLNRPFPLRWWMRIPFMFASKKRREEFRSMFGYVLLEPR